MSSLEETPSGSSRSSVGGDQDIPRIDHVIPGFHVYDGVPYPGAPPKSALDGVKTFRFRDDDLLLVGYPKSGSNWTGQILHLALNGGVPAAYDDILMKHIPMLEAGAQGAYPPCMLTLEGMAGARRMRSHLEVKFFQRAIETKKTKFIVVMRNIKDVLVSFYHMFRSLEILGKFAGNFAEFVGMYKEGRIQDWVEWNLGWWKYRDYPNILFVKYEDLKKDLPGQVRRIMTYLNVDPDDDVIARVCQNASFGQMKEIVEKSDIIQSVFDNDVAPLMRKGQVGDWKAHFTPPLNKYIDRIYTEGLEGSGLCFEFE